MRDAQGTIVFFEDYQQRRDEGHVNFSWSFSEAVESMGGTYANMPMLGRVNGSLSGILSRLLKAISTLQGIGNKKESIELVIYVPCSSATLGAFCRLLFFRRAVRSKDSVLIAAQQRRFSRLLATLCRLARVKIVTLDPIFTEHLKELGVSAQTIIPGIDDQRFRLREQDEQERARQKLGLSLHKRVVLHIGHLSAGRGLDVLIRLAKNRRLSVVMVASTSTEPQSGLKEKLADSGVIVIHELIEDIREVYCAADLYIFPVLDRGAAIGTPLSVLEAIAIGLPVVSTSFGGLPAMFADGEGITYADSVEELCSRAIGVIDGELRLDLGHELCMGWNDVVKRVLAYA